MSSYYHEFTPGFNWWYIGTVAMLALVWFIGWVIPRTSKDKNGRTKLRFVVNNNFRLIVAWPLAILWGLWVFLESHSGILQTFDNLLGSIDDPFWSLIVAACALTACVICMGLVLSAFYSFGRQKKADNLRRRHGITQ